VSDEQGRLKISELAEASGVPVATVRHYLREGLLPEGEKTSRNMAYYPPELVERIRLIKQLQEERFMPLRVIGELLDRENGDVDKLRAELEASDRVYELAIGEMGERIPAAELAQRTGVPAEVIAALEEVDVIGPGSDGYSDADARIVEAIARFRAGGYDESIGFTVHDAARFIEPLEQLAGRELTMLADKLVGRHEPERVVELYEAGIDPLRSLIAAMHDRAVVREIERRRPRADAGGDDAGGSER
jgi:DNA-binding transcriptional MerR regulator